MSNYFISDLHFGHANVLAYDNRPFQNIQDHDKALIQRWNDTITKEDDVYILGDISWHNVMKTIDIIQSLNGKKHLIIGNHDHSFLKNQAFRSLFVEITNYKELTLSDGKGIVLCHYPIPCFNHHYHGWYHLYGHVHNSFEWHMMEHVKYEMMILYEKPCDMYNVGAMIPYMDYTPRTLEEILSSNTTK